MKKLTSVISLSILVIILTASLFLAGGCGNAQPNNNDAAHQPTLYDVAYQPTLSEMTDQEIRDRIDELYDKLDYWTSGSNQASFYAAMIAVCQNELILRQLEGRTIADTNQEPLKGFHKKQGLRDNTKKDNAGKKHLKGLDKKRGLKSLGKKQGLKSLDKALKGRYES